MNAGVFGEHDAKRSFRDPYGGMEDYGGGGDSYGSSDDKRSHHHHHHHHGSPGDGSAAAWNGNDAVPQDGSRPRQRRRVGSPSRQDTH
jgi:hypothetical protein